MCGAALTGFLPFYSLGIDLQSKCLQYFGGMLKPSTGRLLTFLKGYSIFLAKEINAQFDILGGMSMSVPVDEKILQAVLKFAKDGRLSCTVARKLAGDLGVTPGEVGEACNQLKIKIHSCELGCFK